MHHGQSHQSKEQRLHRPLQRSSIDQAPIVEKLPNQSIPFPIRFPRPRRHTSSDDRRFSPRQRTSRRFNQADPQEWSFIKPFEASKPAEEPLPSLHTPSLYQQGPLTRHSSVSLPATSIPTRKSSRQQLRQVPDGSQESRELPLHFPCPPGHPRPLVPTRGKLTSPVRGALQRQGHVIQTPRAPRTFLRSTEPKEILVMPEILHSRISLHIHLGAPLFVGGATVEGHLDITVDGERKNPYRHLPPPIWVHGISVDILGVESALGRHLIYQSLASELVNEDSPPPATMWHGRGPEDGCWEIEPSTSILPFRVDLPMTMGPPPYRSKNAMIRYFFCATIALRVEGRPQLVRKTHEISIITVHDPEKALLNLAFPLTAMDKLFLPRSPREGSVTLTAGVHRQTWVSGTTLFVDAHIANASSKHVKKIELQLEKVTTFYHYNGASTLEEFADHLRLHDRVEKSIVASRRSSRFHGGWPGVKAGSQTERTWALDVPMGLVTVDTGRFFGVRFFLNIRITIACNIMAVQIPLTIIHPNSLDIPPNSLVQVAKAINATLARSHSSRARHAGGASRYEYRQGAPYTAPRRSIEPRRGKYAASIVTTRPQRTLSLQSRRNVPDVEAKMQGKAAFTPIRSLSKRAVDEDSRGVRVPRREKSKSPSQSPSKPEKGRSSEGSDRHLQRASFAPPRTRRLYRAKAPRLQKGTSGLAFSTAESPSEQEWESIATDAMPFAGVSHGLQWKSRMPIMPPKGALPRGHQHSIKAQIRIQSKRSTARQNDPLSPISNEAKSKAQNDDRKHAAKQRDDQTTRLQRKLDDWILPPGPGGYASWETSHEEGGLESADDAHRDEPESSNEEFRKMEQLRRARGSWL